MIRNQIAQMAAKAPEHRVGSMPKETTLPSRFAIGSNAYGALFAANLLLAVSLSSSSDAPARPGGILLAVNVGEAGAYLIQVSDAFKIADVSGPGGTPLRLNIELPENAATTYSFLMFRKLPPNFELSSGFGARTYWAVSLHDVASLQIVPPSDYSGSFELEVLLVKAIGADPERRVVNVEFTPGKAAAAASAETTDNGKFLTSTTPDDVALALPPAVGPRPDEGGERPVSTKELTETQRASMARGDRYLNRGDVAAARLIYHQLARQEIAEGALALARTYDPEILLALAVQGLQPNIDEAKAWYKKAKDLGSAPAAQRLATLNARGY